ARSRAIYPPRFLAQIELLAECDLGRPRAVGVRRVQRPAPLAFVGPVVRAGVARGAEVEAVAARRAQLVPSCFVEQLLGQRELHGVGSADPWEPEPPWVAAL